MSSTTPRRSRALRPSPDFLESVSLVSVLPTLAAVPERMDAQGGGNPR